MLERTRTLLCKKKKWKQRNFLAMARISIIDSEKLDQPNKDRNIILFDALFDKLLNFNILIMFQYLRSSKKLLRYIKCNFNRNSIQNINFLKVYNDVLLNIHQCACISLYIHSLYSIVML